jgi:Sec-independent protein translocase protein TatA
MMASVHLLGLSLGEGEMIVVFVVVILELGSNRRADFLRELRKAISELCKSPSDIAKELDQAGFDTGQSLGGIYVKPASEALTTENH